MHILYLFYVVIIALPLLLVLTILVALITTFGCLIGSPKFWGYHPGKIWSKLVCILLLLPVSVVGREKLDKEKSYVFVANHQGSFDIFLIYGYLQRNFKWMMKKGLRKLPLIGRACESAGHIFVDRSGPKKIKEMIEKAELSLINGVSLVVFPEGARTFTGHMGYFKRGAFQLANDLKMDIVPITINGSFDTLARDAVWPKWNRLQLIIHDPIPYKEEGAAEVKRRLNLAYETIESGLPEEYKGMVENKDQDVF